MRPKLLVVVATAIALIIVTAVPIWTPNRPEQTTAVGESPRALIADELGLTIGGSSFLRRAGLLLEQMGFQVDILPGDSVTVDFFRDLGQKRYGVILLRIHSSGGAGQPTYLFTAEAYSTYKYQLEQFTDQLSRVERTGGQYFAVGPEFVRQSMRNNLQGATVIAMGCNGLSSSKLADAFLSRGARAFVGWDELVTADRTDDSILLLLRQLAEGSMVSQAVAETVELAGPDPLYNSVLRAQLVGNDFRIDSNSFERTVGATAVLAVGPHPVVLALVIGLLAYHLRRPPVRAVIRREAITAPAVILPGL